MLSLCLLRILLCMHSTLQTVLRSKSGGLATFPNPSEVRVNGGCKGYLAIEVRSLFSLLHFLTDVYAPAETM
jgi:hypothetical protein